MTATGSAALLDSDNMTSNDCPRFNSCNACLCPLGQDASHTGYHSGGEPVCYYLRMSRKAGAAERFADDPAFAACLERLPGVVAAYPSIGKAVAQAAKSGFPGEHLRRERMRDDPAPLGACPSQVV